MAIQFDSETIDLYVRQAMQSERKPRENLVDRKDELNTRKSVLSDLDSKLSSLNSKVETLNDPVIDHFAAKTATSSDTEKFTLSATSSASSGTHSISVERLAKSDTRVSHQYSDSGTDFTSITTDQTFSITVGHPTETDSDNRETIEVTISADTFSKSNDEVLKEIADSINSAMYGAVNDETINNDEIVNASVVTESSGNSRLVFRSASSGFKYRMGFNDSSDNLLSTLEISNNVQSSGTSGGYIIDPGSSATDSMLNSKFKIDGLDFYRDSNSVSDAIKGVTINLMDTFSSQETITISPDTESVKEDVKSFIDSYNEALDFLNENTKVDPETNQSSALSGDITYRGLSTDLRNIIASPVDSVSNTEYNKLFNIGIETDDEGKLSIEDSEKFEEALQANPANVSKIFNSSDGVATKMEEYLENYTSTGGSIDTSKDNIESNIVRLNDRISMWDDILAQREQQLRQKYSKIQEMMTKLNNQNSFFNSMF
ncbi:MAG: flagellar filament capping protein FliD [Candidatus Marinimicrobia bacterium]|nr:flagellar filament capping protein FliD [Candidatus Neomarinimicrobiota bacterium]